MKCTKCGHNLPDDSKFCQYCGSSISENATSQPVQDDAETSTAPVQPVRLNLSAVDETPCTFGNYHVSGSDVAFVPENQHKETLVQSTLQPKKTPAQANPTAAEVEPEFRPIASRGTPPMTENDTENPEPHSKGSAIRTALVILFAVLFIVSYMTNINLRKETDILKNENASLETEIAELEDEKNKLQSKLRSYSNEIEFIDEYVVFIEDDGTDMYHKYECSKFLGESFWVFNIAAAEGDGFTPCPRCYG